MGRKWGARLLQSPGPERHIQKHKPLGLEPQGGHLTPALSDPQCKDVAGVTQVELWGEPLTALISPLHHTLWKGQDCPAARAQCPLRQDRQSNLRGRAGSRKDQGHSDVHLRVTLRDD